MVFRQQADHFIIKKRANLTLRDINEARKAGVIDEV